MYNITDKMIGLYESLTPPTGWVLCDGNNGTPNMYDALAFFGATLSGGTRTGDNTISYSYSTGSDVHNHIGSNAWAWRYSPCYHPNNVTRSAHSGSPSGVSFTPPYYALAFIMYKPT